MTGLNSDFNSTFCLNKVSVCEDFYLSTYSVLVTTQYDSRSATVWYSPPWVVIVALYFITLRTNADNINGEQSGTVINKVT